MILKGISVNQDPPTKDHLWITPKGNTRFWDQSTWRLIGGSGGTVLPEIEAAGKYLATTGTSGNYSMVWVDGTGGNYLPLSGGTLTGLLKIKDGEGIESETGNGLLVYKPTAGSWTGVSNTQWAVGASNCQGVIRSDNNDLLHSRNSSIYTILDTANYKSYVCNNYLNLYTSSDYILLVIGLIEYTGSSNSSSSQNSKGTLVYIRDNCVNGYQYTCDYFASDPYLSANPYIEYITNKKSNSSTALDSSNYGFEPCKFTYNNKTWLGFKFYCTQAGILYWSGLNGNNTLKPFVVPYYNANTQTVLNSEIRNSLTYSNITTGTTNSTRTFMTNRLYIGTKNGSEVLNVGGNAIVEGIFGLTQTSGNGTGISLYGGVSSGGNGLPSYGLAFATTANFGKFGDVQGDYATYFTMDTQFGTRRGWIFRTCNTSLNAASISSEGNFCAYGGVTALATSSSDKRLKKEIKPFNAKQIIDKLNPVEFEWNKKANKYNSNLELNKKNYGLIAQDSDNIIDNFVFDLPDGKGYKGVRYEKLIPILLQAVKEQQKEIDELKQIIKKLKV